MGYGPLFLPPPIGALTSGVFGACEAVDPGTAPSSFFNLRLFDLLPMTKHWRALFRSGTFLSAHATPP